MIITPRFKDLLKKAKLAGYKRVVTIVGAYRDTTYCIYYKIDKLLELKDGYNTGSGSPYPQKGMWTGHANTRSMDRYDILYSNVFRKFD